jgi:DOPA 4,5-dioxygenase
MRNVADISGFHAHVYFDATTRGHAIMLAEAVAARFDVKIETPHEQPAGPHPQAQYAVSFAPTQFGAFVSWLMLNRNGLSILVHPLTGDPIADHAESPLWLGEPLPLDIAVMRAYLASATSANA